MVAVLVTPQTGKELRGKIREAFDEATAKLHASGCDCEK
jgi:gas vesicle protein